MMFIWWQDLLDWLEERQDASEIERIKDEPLEDWTDASARPTPGATDEG